MVEPLFPRWSNRALRLGVGALALGVVAAVAAPMLWVRSSAATGIGEELPQPIRFDHSLHVRGLGVDCMYCHEGARTSRYAGVPPTSRCMGCHNQVLREAGSMEPVRASAADGGPLRWSRVHRLGDFVFFDHSIHSAKGVGCVTCHGRVDRMATVSQVAPLTMKWCLDCHRDPTLHLRPLERITAMEESVTDPPARAKLATELDVHPRTDCSACHR